SGVPLGAVHQASNGTEGLAALGEHAIDLVMLDISMPGMRGDEMLEQVRAAPATADLPVIVISSERTTERVARMEALGAIYLPKPFLPEQLRDIVIDVTGARK